MIKHLKPKSKIEIRIAYWRDIFYVVSHPRKIDIAGLFIIGILFLLMGLGIAVITISHNIIDITAGIIVVVLVFLAIFGILDIEAKYKNL